jgi:hypothetical protein
VLCRATGQFITLQVLNGSDGALLETVMLQGTLKQLSKKLGKTELAQLEFAIANRSTTPPAVVKNKAQGNRVGKDEPKKPEPKTELATKTKDEATRTEPVPQKEDPPATVVSNRPSEAEASTHPALRLSLGVGGFNRDLRWQGNPSPTLATANQPFSGAISVDASWYPGAHFTSNFLSNLGVFLNGDFGVGMVSRVQESRFAHSASRLRFGGLVRLPIGQRFIISAHLGYSRHELTTSLNAVNDGSARPNLPDVLFNGFRVGVGLRWRIAGTVEFDATGSFQAVAGKGEIASARYFPRATALAFDAGGGLSVEVAQHLRLRAGAEWQRYFITLNPSDTSTFFARTAADQYITVAASLQWVM